jgi:hypothetical protein
MSTNRPDAIRVARRLLVLKPLICHGYDAPPRDLMAQLVQRMSGPDLEAMRGKIDEHDRQMWGRLRDAGLWDELSPNELHFTTRTILDMTAQEQINFTWRMEAAVMLMWALQMIPDAPGLDVPTEPKVLKLIAPAVNVPEFIAAARLRQEAEIDKERNRWELWHWRSRTRQLIEQGAGPDLGAQAKAAGFETLDDVVRKTAGWAHEQGMLAETLDNDFVVRGQPFRALSAKEWSFVRSCIQERHFALNWLCGHAPGNRWDETPTDT